MVDWKFALSERSTSSNLSSVWAGLARDGKRHDAAVALRCFWSCPCAEGG